MTPGPQALTRSVSLCISQEPSVEGWTEFTDEDQAWVPGSGLHNQHVTSHSSPQICLAQRPMLFFHFYSNLLSVAQPRTMFQGLRRTKNGKDSKEPVCLAGDWPLGLRPKGTGRFSLPRRTLGASLGSGFPGNLHMSAFQPEHLFPRSHYTRTKGPPGSPNDRARNSLQVSLQPLGYGWTGVQACKHAGRKEQDTEQY
jgi:hypothetical protein